MVDERDPKVDSAPEFTPGVAFARYPELAGRAAYVTGGATGIGATIVRALLEAGVRVTFCDRNQPAGEALVGAARAAGLTAPVFEALDVTDTRRLQASVAGAGGAGGIHLLVNNAAVDDRQAIETVSEADFDQGIALNLRHLFFAAQAARPLLIAAGGGAILNMASVNAHLGPPELAVYSAAKAGVLGLTRALARAFGPDRIRVNAILPGWVMTQRQRRLWLTPDAEAALMDEQCLKETIAPADVAALVLFLASDGARMITNQSIVVDGGRI